MDKNATAATRTNVPSAEGRLLAEVAIRVGRAAAEKAFALGLPITFWRNAKLFHRFPDGTETEVPASEIEAVAGIAP